jgi:hypothetical protein
MNYLKKSLLLFCALQHNTAYAQNNKTAYPDYLQPDHAVNAVTMVMVHDVVSPPVAARYYAYSMLGAYSIVAANNKTIPQLQSFIKIIKPGNSLDTISFKYDSKIAAFYSILETARLMLPSGFMITDDRTRLSSCSKR